MGHAQPPKPMTFSEDHDLLEAFPIPEGSIVLPPTEQARSRRGSVVEALQLAIQERALSIPLGPQTALDDDERLLVLNRFGLQLSIGGFLSDELELDLQPWLDGNAGPHLAVGALVDDENDLVLIQGVLTGAELHRLVAKQSNSGSSVAVAVNAFHGGIQRLFSLVQLLEPSALPAVDWRSDGKHLIDGVVSVVGWMKGQLDESLAKLGGQLQPVTATAFRSTGDASLPSDAQAVLTIPLGLNSNNALVNGEGSQDCIERFQLKLVLQGKNDDTSTRLVVQVCPELPGDLLPDGLELQLVEGGREQRQTSSNDQQLALIASEHDSLLAITLGYGNSPPLMLPPLQLS